MSDWSVHVSRSTSKQYWFNRRTALTTASQSIAPPTGSLGAAPSHPAENMKAAAATLDIADATPIPTQLLSSDASEFRAAVEQVCIGLAAVRDNAAKLGAVPTPPLSAPPLSSPFNSAKLTPEYARLTAKGYYNFPYYDKHHTAMLQEIVEDYGLLMRKVGEGDDRHVVVYSALFKSAEVLEFEAEQAALEQEAREIKAREAAALEELAQKAAKAPKRKRNADRDVVIQQLAKEAVEVKRGAPRDKSIQEVQEELKRRRVEQDPSEGKGFIAVDADGNPAARKDEDGSAT